MDWSQTPRVLLIWPEKGKVLQSQLDLVLLERYCSSSGSQLAILTKDPVIIFQAEVAGIPVFQSRKRAQLQPWGKSFREFSRRDLVKKAGEVRENDLFIKKDNTPSKIISPWIRILLFTLAVLSVLSIAGMLLPSASISIQKNIQNKTLVIPIQADLEENQIKLSGIVPAHELFFQIEDRLSLLATGTTSLPSEYARGEVTFTNLGEDSISIPKKTMLSTPGENPIRFLTLAPGDTPPGIGETVTILIEALSPGITGNVSENRISSIQMALGAELSVTNPLPLSGGTNLLIPAPSFTDRRNLNFQLSKNLESLAQDEIENQINPEDILLTPELINPEVLEEQFSPEEGLPGNQLWLEKKVQYLVYYVSAEDLLSLAESLIKAQYQASEFEPLLDSIQLTQLSIPDMGTGQSFSWKMKVTWNESRIFNQQEIIQIVLGLKPLDAIHLLEKEYNLDSSPLIDLKPGWWPRIPAVPFRIKITHGDG